LINGAIKIPTKTFKKLYHVGSLDIKKRRKDNLEGKGLSVSTEPDAWRDINRGRTTGDTWVLTKSGNKFIDYHKLTEAHLSIIHKWAIENKYADQDTVYKVCWYDDEYDEDVCMEFDDLEEAKEEAEGMGGEIEKKESEIVGTSKLKQRMGGTHIELLAVVYAEDVLKIDGVHWEDTLDTQKLSAPRGVIVMSKIKSWKKKMIQKK